MAESSDFQIILREGIVGGFVPPTVKQVVHITGNDTGAAIVHNSAKETSKGEFSTQSGTLSSAQAKPLAQSLKDALSQLPIESPPGSEDIYGLDISIAFQSNDFEWYNGGPEGCGAGMSDVQATSEQKQVFKSLVQSLLGTVQQFAVKAQD